VREEFQNRYAVLAPGDITILDAIRYLIVRV